jgi:hypothetical protein
MTRRKPACAFAMWVLKHPLVPVKSKQRLCEHDMSAFAKSNRSDTERVLFAMYILILDFIDFNPANVRKLIHSLCEPSPPLHECARPP